MGYYDYIYFKRNGFRRLDKNERSVTEGIAGDLIKRINSLDTFSHLKGVISSLLDGDFKRWFYNVNKGKGFSSIWDDYFDGLMTEEEFKTYAVNMIIAYKADSLEQIAQALTTKYNPLHNYDRTFDRTETHEGEDITNRDNQSTQLEADEEENFITGFGSNDYVKDSKRTEKEGPRKSVENETINHGHKVTYHEEEKGNIGVTKAQDMIKEEIDIRTKFTFMQIFTDLISDVLFLSIY